ncbi:hypothetical protein ON010_g18965 [Phytophthora cinnamomi]|nr:hypothetical protein ON010_g18965 [Phytophthora cinnamomi]
MLRHQAARERDARRGDKVESYYSICEAGQRLGVAAKENTTGANFGGAGERGTNLICSPALKIFGTFGARGGGGASHLQEVTHCSTRRTRRSGVRRS